MLDQRGFFLRAQQAHAFDRGRRTRVRAGDELEPELARFGTDACIGIVACEALCQRGIGETLQCGGAHARIGILSRNARELGEQFRIVFLGDTGPTHGGFLGLPARLVEKSGKLHCHARGCSISVVRKGS